MGLGATPTRVTTVLILFKRLILFLVFKRVTGQRDSCARVLGFLEVCSHGYIKGMPSYVRY